jgi:diguanylate cyclase (GGDEF)-like protein
MDCLPPRKASLYNVTVRLSGQTGAEENSVRLSISARVSMACALVILLSMLLLAIGLSVSNDIHYANERVTLLSLALQTEDQHDQAQRNLRLNVGEATRDAEHGTRVSASRWAGLWQQAADFERLSSPVTTLCLRSEAGTASIAIRETRRAAVAFVQQSRSLMYTARTNPSLVKAAMPQFLSSLKKLESSRSSARELLATEIGLAAERNGRESRQNIIALLLGGLAIVALIFVMTIWLRRQLLLPITVIAERLREFKLGGDDGDVPGLKRADELGDLARGLFDYHAAVNHRRAAERRAEFLAHHDMLTGLANRLLFENRLAHELSRSDRTGDTVAVLAIDLDGFKAINDQLGHAGGDRALKQAADLLLGCVRSDDLVARIGGDEFAIIQVAHAQPAAAEALIARVFRALSASTDEIHIQMSIGVALSEPEQTGEELHELADLALYRAKADGRNNARFFNENLKQEESVRRRLARDLEDAFSTKQLHLAYQPIANAASMTTVGYEALLRWDHPTLGEIPPHIFIPVAEATGLISSIGSWVIDQALAEASTWDQSLSLAINLSPLQFRSNGLAAEIVNAAHAWDVPLSRLELEVTESATLLGQQRGNVLRTLRTLQAIGVRIVMDDFGTGHSSLSNLKDFSFDKLKLDRSFVAEMLDHPSSASIVKATVGLGKSLGLTIVAEGVESKDQLDTLRLWGCDQVQGFLVGRPTNSGFKIGRPTLEHNVAGY